MNQRVERFDSGWIGVSLAMGRDEVVELITQLQALQQGKIGHFHLRTDDFSGSAGIADIEISLMGEEDSNNMSVG